MDEKNLAPDIVLARQARALLLGTTVLWGLSFPLLRGLQLAQHQAAPDLPDSLLACANMAIRFGLAALLLLPFCARNLFRVTAREWSQATGLALFASAGLYLQTLGLAWTDASVSAFLTQLYTLIVPLIVAVRDRRFPSRRVIIACLLVLAGAALLSPGLLTHLTLGSGELVIILSSLFLAGQIVWVERPVYAENRPGLVTLLMFAIMAALFASGLLTTGETPRLVKSLFGTPALLELALALVLFCTAFNFLIMNAWQRRITATEAGLIYCLEPVIATVLSSFLPGMISHFADISYPNETMPWTLLAGGVLIVTATVLVATERRS